MKRKLLISLLSVACASCCAIGLTACDKDNPNPNPGPSIDGDYPTYKRDEVIEETKLAYEMNEGGSYSITGIGAETKTDIVIPAMIGEIPVTEIAASAFAGKTKITSVTIADGITAIGASAFSNCSTLKSIRLPDTVTTVGESAFVNCTGLLTVILGNGLTAISNSMFEGCVGLKLINIPDNVTSIGESAFFNCVGLNKVNMGSGVLKVGYKAFAECGSLTNIELGSGVTELGKNVFENCEALERVVLPNSVRYIGLNMLTGCSNIKIIQVPFVGAFRYNDPPEHLLPKEDEGEEGGEGDTTWQGTIDINKPTTYGHFGYFFGATSNYDNNSYTQGAISDVTVIITGDSPITNGSFNNVWGVTRVVICGGMTTIMEQGLAFMWELKTLVLPKSMKEIQDSVFYSSSTLQTVYYEGTASDWSGISIASNNNGPVQSAARVYYSNDSKDKGKWHYDDYNLPVMW